MMNVGGLIIVVTRVTVSTAGIMSIVSTVMATIAAAVLATTNATIYIWRVRRALYFIINLIDDGIFVTREYTLRRTPLLK